MKDFPSLRELSRLLFNPKETIREIVAIDPSRYFLWMATLYGFLWMLAASAAQHLADHYTVHYIVVAALFFALPIGYILLNMTTLFCHCCGRLLGGVGSYLEVRAAITWAQMPRTFLTVCWAVWIIILDRRTFLYNDPLLDLSDTSLYIVNFTSILYLITLIWTLVISCKTLAEVEKFSSWRALCVYFLAAIGEFAFLFITVLFFFHFHPG